MEICEARAHLDKVHENSHCAFLTSYERDNETGLDYAKARMFGYSLGRFTSPDPLLSSGRIENPQTWNRYAYVLNNPLVFIDPLGLYEWSAELGGSTADDKLEATYGKKKAEKIRKRRDIFRNGLKAAKDAGSRSDNPDEVARATGSYGCEAIATGCTNGANGVTVTFGKTTNGDPAEAGPNGAALSFAADGTATAQVLVTINENKTNDSVNSLAEYIGHEGVHVADRQSFATYLTGQIKAAGGLENFTPALQQAAFASARNRTIQQTEFNAYIVSGLIAQGRDAITSQVPNRSYGGHEVWNRSWSAAERPSLRAVGAFEHVTTSSSYVNRLNQRMFPQ